MGLYEIKTKDEWQSLLDEISKETGLPSALADTENKLLQTSGERNALCTFIRSEPESIFLVCQKSQMAMAGEARAMKKPSVEICEAGLAKFVVPLFEGEEYVGCLTACGGSFTEDDVDAFVIGKSTKAEQGKIEQLMKSVPSVDEDKITALANRLYQEIK